MNGKHKLLTLFVLLCPLAALAQEARAQEARAQEAVAQEAVVQEARAEEDRQPSAQENRLGEGPIIELESRVTGNQEQPQVFHVVPWQSPQMSVPGYNPLSSQLQDVFGHLERDELQRQLQRSENIHESGG